TLFTRYEPLQDQLYEAVDLPRLAHAGWVLARAAHHHDAAAGDGATRIIEYLLSTIRETDDGCWLVAPDHHLSVGEIALLTLALCERPQHGLSIFWVPRLAATLWSRIDRHGRIDPHADAIADAEPYQDYFPGQMLLALAAAVRTGLTSIDELKLTRA